MTGWQVAALEEIEERNDGRCPYRAVRHELGITTFGATTWTARVAGDRLLNEHDESEPGSGDELYLVLSGEARFELDGESVAAPTGTFVRVQPGVMRTAFAEEAGTTILVIGGAPEGVAYEPDGWEVIAPIIPLFRERRGEEALARLQALLDEGARYPEIYYGMACAESQMGRSEDALGHLRTAIERQPALAEWARGDDDLAAIRGEPQFARITGAGG